MGQQNNKYSFATTFPAYPHTCTVPLAEQHVKKIDTNSNAQITTIQHLLSSQECQYYIQQAEKIGFTSLASEYPETYRNNTRLLVQSDVIAQILYTRIAIHMMHQFLNAKPFGFDSEGVWRPTSLNSVLKFNKYEKGCKFAPHVDNMYCASANQRSIYTVIIYLNDDFMGGNTRFFKRSTSSELPMEQIQDDNMLLHTVKPETGTCLIFNHDVLHDGEEVASGTKYIIRGEIMFERMGDNIGTLNAMHKQFLLSSTLFMKADQLEMRGLLFDSTETYLRGLQLQIDYSTLPKNELPFELVQHIVRFVYDPKQMASLARVSRRWYYAVMGNTIWKQLFFATFGDAKSNLKSENWFIKYRDNHLVTEQKAMAVFVVGSNRLQFGVAGMVAPYVDEMSVYNGTLFHGYFCSNILFGAKAVASTYYESLNYCMFEISVTNSDICTRMREAMNISLTSEMLLVSPNLDPVEDEENYIIPRFIAVAAGVGLQEGIIWYSGGCHTCFLLIQDGLVAAGTCTLSAGYTFDEKILGLSPYSYFNYDELLSKKAPFKVLPKGALLAETMKKAMHDSIQGHNKYTDYKMFEVIDKHITDSMSAITSLLQAKKLMHLLHTVILAGGNTMINGYPERIQQELSAIAFADQSVQVFAHAERKTYKWLGASKIGCNRDKYKKLIDSAKNVKFI